MLSGVGGDRRMTKAFLEDFAAGTRAIGGIADMLEGLPEEELTRPTGFPPINPKCKRPASGGMGRGAKA